MSGVGIPIVTKINDSSCCPIPPVSKSRHSISCIYDHGFDDDDEDESRYNRTAFNQDQQRYSLCTPTGDFMTSIGTDYDQVLEATLTLHYYNIINCARTCSSEKSSSSFLFFEGGVTQSISFTTTTTTFVEMHLRCSFLGQAFSSHNQKYATCRIPISAVKETWDDCHHLEMASRKYQYTWSDVIPSVVFSSGGTFIACLVPHPIRIDEYDSTEPLCKSPEKASIYSNQTPSLSSVVIFSVNKSFSGERISSPHNVHSRSNIPLPTYVTQSLPTSSTMERNSESDLPYISNARVVRIDSSPSDTLDYAASKVHQVTSICNMTTPTLSSSTNNNNTYSEAREDLKSSILLAGCTDGSILAIGYKRARLLHIWLQPNRDSSIHDLLDDTSMTNTATSSHGFSPMKAVPWNNSDQGIIFMAHNQYVNKQFEIAASQSQKRGKLAIIRRDGEAICFSTWYYRTKSSSITFQQCNDEISAIDTLSLPHSIHANGWDNDTGENDDKPFAGLNIPSSEFVLNERRGVILRISPLPFTFHAKSKEVSSSRLMYYRCLFVVDYLIAFLVRPIKANIDSSRNRNSIIADIWYLRDQSGTSTLLSELSMTAENLREAHHDTFTSCYELLPVNQCRWDTFYETSASIYFSGIQMYCDPRTNCVVVESAIEHEMAQTSSSSMLRFSTIWDFRGNVCGFTLLRTPTVSLQGQVDDATFGDGFSALRFSNLNCSHYGPLVHIFLQGGKFRKVRYEYSVAMSTDTRSKLPIVRLDIASHLTTSSDSISFPVCSMPSFCRDFSLNFSDVAAPNHMIPNYGPIKLSAIGRSKGRSVAIACDHGFSILDIPCQSYDTSRRKAPFCGEEKLSIKTVSTDFAVGPYAQELLIERTKRMKWRSFGNSHEERAISVICMTWWERLFEDLLIAVVLYDSSRNCIGKPFLTCWSSKRIDYENQLMTSDGKMFALGVPLPPDISPMMISLLSMPASDSSRGVANMKQDDRAVVLISEIHEEGLIFSIFHIQSSNSSKIGASWSTKRLIVFAKLHLQGNIKFSSEPCPSFEDIGGKFYSIFISGASFSFNLLQNDTKNLDDRYGQSDTFVTLALLTDFGERLYALKILPSQGVQRYFIEHKLISISTKNFISRILMGGMFESMDSNVCYISWTFVISCGESFSWFVPSISITRLTEEGRTEESKWGYSKDLLFGKVSYEGNCLKLRSSDSGCILLAPLPCPAFRYILFIQQQSWVIKKIPRIASLDIRQKVFGVGDFILGPPTFISIIYHIIMDRCTNLNNNLASPLSKCNPLDVLFICFKSYDSFRIALGFIVPFIVDLIYATSQSDSHTSTPSKMLLSQLVSATRKVLTPLEFATVYINIGRLLEPHHFDCLFPLPSEEVHTHLSTTQVNSLDDMVSLCIRCGSAKVLSSSLTMNPRKYSSHKICNQIFHHYVTVILNSSRLDGGMQANIVLEDLPYLMQLYRYSLKLEDSNNFDISIDDGGSNFSDREGERSYNFLETPPMRDEYPLSNMTGGKSTSRVLHYTNDVEGAIADAASNFILYGMRSRTDSTIPIAFVGLDFIHVMLSKLLIAEIVFRSPKANIVDWNLMKSWKLLALISMLLENETSESQIQRTSLLNLFSNISSHELIFGLRVGRSTDTHPRTTSDVITFVRELSYFSLSYLSTREILALNKLTTEILTNGQISSHIDTVRPPILFLFLATCHLNEALYECISVSKNVLIADIVASLGSVQKLKL